MTHAPLGEFELVLLMATMHLDEDEAFGSSIRAELEQRSGRPVARGSLYVTLDRLEQKGLLSSLLIGGGAKRRGQPKRVFRVTRRGVEHVRASVTVMARVHAGLEAKLGNL